MVEDLSEELRVDKYIVSIYDVGEENDIYFIVMEYVKGLNYTDKEYRIVDINIKDTNGEIKKMDIILEEMRFMNEFWEMIKNILSDKI